MEYSQNSCACFFQSQRRRLRVSFFLNREWHIGSGHPHHHPITMVTRRQMLPHVLHTMVRWLCCFLESWFTPVYKCTNHKPSPVTIVSNQFQEPASLKHIRIFFSSVTFVVSAHGRQTTKQNGTQVIGQMSVRERWYEWCKMIGKIKTTQVTETSR